MLNPFPQLLTFGFFAPTLLRLAAAGVLFLIALRTYRGGATIATNSFPVIGKHGNPLLIQVAAGITALAGAALFVGYATQWAAILGIVIGLKLLWLRKELEPSIRFSPAVYTLFIALCLSLLLTGAGGYAFDLPL